MFNLENNKNRPKANMTNSKIWDSIASKTICVDFAMLHNKQ